MLLQPTLTILEDQPQRRVYGSISMTEGSPWCKGGKMVWLVGHQKNETPICYDTDLDTWTIPMYAKLDETDPLDSTPTYVDRHDCTTLDVNRDGLLDIVCVMGANRGEGEGYTELYLTQQNGSVVKVPRHGLQKYPTVRGRYVETLYNTADPGNITHVFVSAFGSVRPDGAWNRHTMYRLTTTTNTTTTTTTSNNTTSDQDYFEEVPGTYNIHGFAMQLKVYDWNNDGRDDFMLLQKADWALFYEQQEGGSFKELKYPHSFRTNCIRAARLADLNGDGILDLIVSTRKFRNIANKWMKPAIKVFLGVNGPSRFDFSSYYYAKALPYEAPDLEILDVNNDGIPDIYIVQTDQTTGSFCGEYMEWTFSNDPSIDPDPGWYADIDHAPDLVLLGKGFNDKKSKRFEIIPMEFELPGCGYLAQKFGNNKTIILANGDEGHPGSNVILTW